MRWGSQGVPPQTSSNPTKEATLDSAARQGSERLEDALSRALGTVTTAL
jgi:hypothetical protein